MSRSAGTLDVIEKYADIGVHACTRCRTAVSLTSEEIRSQLNAFRDRERELQRRNNELEHLLLDRDVKVDSLQEQVRVTSEAVSCGPKSAVHIFILE